MSRGRTRAAASCAAALVLAGVAPVAAGAEPAGTDEITVDGTAVVVVIDDFPTAPTTAPADTFVSIDVDGTLVPVPDAEAGGLSAGDPVTVTLTAPDGMPVDAAVAAAGDPGAAVEVVDVAPAPEAAPTGPDATRLAAASPAGAHTLAVLPVHWAGGPAPDATTSDLTAMAQDVEAYWTETSRGAMQFAAPVVEDWVEIPAPTSCSEMTGAVQQIYDDALAAHGYPYSSVLPPGPATHVVVYFPDWAQCRWLGLASVDDGRVWVNGDPRSEVLAHEVGHNLGLGHANAKTCRTASGAAVPDLLEDPGTPADGTCTLTEYGDWADLMGSVWYQPPGNLTTALAAGLRFVDLLDPPTTGVSTVHLAPLGDEAGLRAVRIPLSTTRSFYVDYRPLADRDTRQPSWAGVQVHERGLDSSGSIVSYLLTMNPAGAGVPLAAGSRYTFPAVRGGGWTVVVDGVGSTADLRVVPPAGFIDVSGGHPFYADIAWLRHAGVSTGWSTPSGPAFRPGDAVSRQAMAAFLYRAAGSPSFTPPATSPFVDVSTGDPFYAAIAWLAQQGISSGTATPRGALYAPGSAVARDAMAAFLYRAAGSPPVTLPATSPFVDVAPSHPFYAAIVWMAQTGISRGTATPAGLGFAPAAPVTREAMAAFLFRSDAWHRAHPV